jgi:hypothetical protein
MRRVQPNYPPQGKTLSSNRKEGTYPCIFRRGVPDRTADVDDYAGRIASAEEKPSQMLTHDIHFGRTL